MTLEKVKESYKNLIEAEKVKLSKLKKAIFQIGTLRLIVVLACIGCCYIAWGNTAIVLVAIGLSMVLFLFLLKYHNKLFLKKRYCELLIQNAENELKGIEYDFSAFDGFADKADANHSYSLDLDLFGDHSFFQSVNRSVTSYGKEKLADVFLYPFNKKDDILLQQDALKELSGKSKLLNHFRAIGQMSTTEDLDVQYFSQQFLQTNLLIKSFWKYFIYITPAVFIILFILSATGLIPLSVMGLCWVAFFVLSLIPMKDIRPKMNLFEKKMDTLQTYSELFKIIEEEQFKSALLKNIQDKVKEDGIASMAIHQLKSYSNNLDQSSNILGLLILNPFFFWNVIFALKIEKWVMKHTGNISRWFEALAEFDSLVSLSIFSYNNPNYSYPEVSDTFSFEGKDLGHPMLNRNICVRNDITINKQPFFLVVTGANMAGKSTYLRTIGINLTLACAGAPVCAAYLKFYPFSLVTNLRTSDSLTDNESYFFAELKRLKMIIDQEKNCLLSLMKY